MSARLARRLLLAAAFAASPASLAGAETRSDEAPPADAVSEARSRVINYSFFQRPFTAKESEVALGRKLFFDAGLSRNGKMSCATCHQPARHFADGLPRAVGRGKKVLPRNTPSLLTAVYSSQLAWDGRSDSIEQSALMALESRDEMDQDAEGLAARLRASREYAAAFDDAYGPAGISSTTIARALAAFVTSLAPPEDSPWDRFMKDGSGLSPAALRGFVLFSGRAGCVQCHPSKNLQHLRMFANTGVSPSSPVDAGRYGVDPRPMMWGAFRVPSLRNVALTAPYMHDGSLKTLRDVVEFYDRGGDARDRYEDASMRPLSLSERDKEDLVAFLESLTSARAAASAAEEPK